MRYRESPLKVRYHHEHDANDGRAACVLCVQHALWASYALSKPFSDLAIESSYNALLK